MWWQDILWGIWNGMSGWVIVIAHAFGALGQYPFYNVARPSNWYNAGFLIGAGSPFLGAFGARRRGRGRQ